MFNLIFNQGRSDRRDDAKRCEQKKKLLFTFYSFALFFYFVFVIYFFKYACTVHTCVLASLAKKFSLLRKETYVNFASCETQKILCDLLGKINFSLVRKQILQIDFHVFP